MPRPRALVVEDDLDLLFIYRQALAEAYDVAGAQSLQEAHEQLESGNPQLLILDLWLPDGEGESLLREIEEDETIVIVATAQAHRGSSLCSHPAIELVLYKPVSFMQLRQLGRRYLSEE